MTKTYKILSLLLSYPEKDLQEFLNDAYSELEKENMLKASDYEGIRKFIRYYSQISLMDWQEQYVQLFDFSRTASLHLFEHVHGNSRERGQAMVDLAEEYSGAGLNLKPHELPDYLPVFLEYLSVIPPRKASSLLGETVYILAAIHYRLQEKDHPYAFLLEALIHLTGKSVGEEVLKKIIRNQKPLDPDKEYEDPVGFNKENDSCKNCK